MWKKKLTWKEDWVQVWKTIKKEAWETKWKKVSVPIWKEVQVSRRHTPPTPTGYEYSPDAAAAAV